MASKKVLRCANHRFMGLLVIVALEWIGQGVERIGLNENENQPESLLLSMMVAECLGRL